MLAQQVFVVDMHIDGSQAPLYAEAQGTVRMFDSTLDGTVLLLEFLGDVIAPEFLLDEMYSLIPDNLPEMILGTFQRLVNGWNLSGAVTLTPLVNRNHVYLFHVVCY